MSDKVVQGPPFTGPKRRPIEIVQRAESEDLDQPGAEARADEVGQALHDLVTYHAPVGDQASRHEILAEAAKAFIATIISMVDPSPDRSQAISKAREAKMWASAALSQEPAE